MTTNAATKAAPRKTSPIRVVETTVDDTPKPTERVNKTPQATLDAVKRSQAAKKEAVDALIKAHQAEFDGLWAASREAHSISDRKSKAAERKAEEAKKFLAGLSPEERAALMAGL